MAGMSELSRQPEIVAQASEVVAVLEEIKAQGGFCHRMNVERTTYTLMIHWPEPKDQGELF